jgi:hypothetical protein
LDFAAAAMALRIVVGRRLRKQVRMSTMATTLPTLPGQRRESHNYCHWSRKRHPVRNSWEKDAADVAARGAMRQREVESRIVGMAWYFIRGMQLWFLARPLRDESQQETAR